jgi:hypothetical protein
MRPFHAFVKCCQPPLAHTAPRGQLLSSERIHYTLAAFSLTPQSATVLWNDPGVRPYGRIRSQLRDMNVRLRRITELLKHDQSQDTPCKVDEVTDYALPNLPGKFIVILRLANPGRADNTSQPETAVPLVARRDTVAVE